MNVLFGEITWLAAMGMLILASAFFSSSEAAMFLLTPHDQRRLARGNRAQRTAARLLQRPDQLLSTILFCNLIINVTYFTFSSIISLRLQTAGETTVAAVFGVGSLIVIILLAELLPKAIAVLRPQLLASLASLPLSGAIRLFQPVLPIFARLNLLSQRLVWPSFRPEPYLEVGDLERAVEISTSDAEMVEQEKIVLQNILALTETRVDELMRPRMRFLLFHPPVSLSDLDGQMTPSGYVLITEPDSDEVALALPLKTMAHVPAENLETLADPVVYVPWCTSVGRVLEQMRETDRQVAAVVNEFGETIGILTYHDILRAIFGEGESRSERLLNLAEITATDDDGWHASGMVTVRSLANIVGEELPETHSVTLAGVVHEVLGRMPQVGDAGVWGPLAFEVSETFERGKLSVRLHRASSQESPE